LEKRNKIKPYENRTTDKAVYVGHTVATMTLWALQQLYKVSLLHCYCTTIYNSYLHNDSTTC